VKIPSKKQPRLLAGVSKSAGLCGNRTLGEGEKEGKKINDSFKAVRVWNGTTVRSPGGRRLRALKQLAGQSKAENLSKGHSPGKTTINE